MKKKVTIGLVGDYDESVVAHRAIPLAIGRAAIELRVDAAFEWVPTAEIIAVARISSFDGLWCVPGSPYRNTDGALCAIRYARENAVPFLGTCGGFQHVIVEYARNVLGWADADHAETAPGAARAVITPLACALVEVTGALRLFSGTRIASAYGVERISEGYQCRFGLNPAFQSALVAGPLRASADDETSEVRAVELDEHPFFIATLFQPERAALADKPVPLATAFLRAFATYFGISDSRP
ncbi:MAG: hypothetical protein A2W18_10330 [Candidatus Muproteobacteria bacterium RBG_16_60_9]|uniref:CTP synthase (glutamine hydrolyzing) n=1 Tax=Candidatus Muproteobacteria bacterium RBG_16_60_9 TaxID=1817755 RepID=A0A1F6VLG3_9PROT|nr:MAG: hypothetical protein A2W18_10330 [Candidatus Muproteobacteria bacterium RBG_16_60_9]